MVTQLASIVSQVRRRAASSRTSLTASTRHAAMPFSFAALVCVLAAGVSSGQTPVVLPNTISTIAGSTPVVTTTGAACPTNAQFTATDGIGNGCPAANATFGGNERSMTVDPLGNVYIINDSANPQDIRRIDARTGNITIFAGAGGGNACPSPGITVYGTTYIQTDKVGDGCPAYLSGGFNGGRGLGSDPYGNLVFGVTGDQAVHFICTAVSPLCTAAQVRVNLMRAVAGCTPSATGYGTAVTGATVGTAGDGGPATQFSGTCTVGVSSPRQAAGDRWDNVYFTDNSNSRIRVVLGVPSITVNGVSVPNPLYATLATSTTAPLNYSTPVQGNIYPIAGGGTACAAKTDAGGDGCPFYNTVVASSTTVQGLAVDNDGDFIFVDGQGRLRTIYEGGTAIKSALAANAVSTPVIGTSYALIGNGGTSLYYNSALSGVYLGSQVSLQAGAVQRLALDSVGNVYIGDQAQVFFYDIFTGYVRRLGGGTTAVSCNASAIGDGCPIAQSLFGNANLVLSVGLDNIGNLYIQDLQNKSIRRVSASTLPATAVNASISAPLVVHAPAPSSTVAVSATPSSEYSVGSSTCAAANADGTVDCTVPVTFAPKLLAQQNDPISIATTVGAGTTTRNSFFNASVTGSALVFDVSSAPATTVVGAGTTGNIAVALDGDGNAYVLGTQGLSKVTSAGATTVIAAPTVPAQAYVAVDPQGNVYTTSGSTTTINKYVFASGTYTPSTLNIPMLSIGGVLTQGDSGPLAVDANGVVYLADLVNKQVVKFSQTTGTGQQLTQTALTSPTSLTQDTYGNLLVLDGTTLLKVPSAGIVTATASPLLTPTVSITLAAPTAVAADQGGNIYVADSGSLIALSNSGTQYTIPGLSGTGVAADGAGNLYLTKSSAAGITVVARNAESHAFGTDVATPYVGVFLNAGATASTGFSQTDAGGNFSYLAPASPVAGGPTCNLASTALAAGALCNTSIKFSPTATGSGTVPDVISLLPAANTIGSLAISGVKNGSTATTTTGITGNTVGLVYSTSTETTFTITVTQSSGQPAGSVTVSIDGGTATSYALTAATTSTATASVPVAGLTATSHNIVANYAGSAGIAGSTSATTSFSIGQASTSVSWTPGSNTQQYSSAIGTGVLNATASSAGGAVVGNFIYTATPSVGAPFQVHSASYLPIGTYSFAVTFVPNDAVDFTNSTGSFASYTVTKASTSAPVGTTQNLVALDGTGNFTSVQAAINNIPTAGGSIYIKPGTYVGDITVVQSNLAMRGLGGDPTKVVLTHSGGAFGGVGVYQYAGEFTAAQNNGSQLPAGSSVFNGDEGSATLVVAKGVNTAVSASTITPNNFYAENFTLANTWDTDNTTTTTTYVSGGNCTANAGPAQTYFALFNAGTECASQALAIWTTADLAVMNNIYTTSLQDTIYAGSQGLGGNGYVPARQYWFRGKVVGNVDYIFGDAAVAFDYSSIFTAYHGTTAGGTETIEAQNKARQTGSAGDYLSGYVMNSNVFTSQSSGMNGLYFGRPYGTYSTWIMLNSYVDQVAPVGYIEFSGNTNLPTSTYAEYNNLTYTDPANGAADLNGVIYTGTGVSTGAGVNGTRETTSTDPGTLEAANAVKTSLTAAQAQQYYPTNFLGTTVSSLLSTTANWNPTAAMAAGANAFVPAGTSASITGGSSVTILMRPQTPGLGAVSNGNYTIPTGTYSLSDTFNGFTYSIATGNLDAAGEAYYTTNSLAAGTHNLSWVYSGDSNFSGSTTASAYVLTISGTSATTTTTLGAPASPITYGQSANLTATVSSASGTPTGTVTLFLDGAAIQTSPLSGGSVSFSAIGIRAGSRSFTATYNGVTAFAPSSTAGSQSLVVAKAVLTATGSCTNRVYGQANSCSATVTGYQYTDSASTVFTGTPTATTVALRNSPAGPYGASPVASSLTETTFGQTNYTVNTAAKTSFNVTGGAPQSIIFAALPNFPHTGSYQLTARTTSGLPLTYTVTAGNGIASVSGATLTVTGAGNVTIQASQTVDPTGDYAPASPVSVSFVAQ